MRARLRTAWNATCGSSAQACTQRSPPERVRVELVARQRGRAVASERRPPRRRARSGLAAARTAPARSPNVIVSRAAGRPSASPVSSGGASAVAGRRPDRTRPRSSAPRRRVQARSRSRSSLARSTVDVERREHQPVLRRRGDARLVLAVERDGRPRRAPGASSLLAPSAYPTPPPSATPSAPPPAAAAAGGGRARRPARLLGSLTPQLRPWPPPCESGSASASTAADSWRRSSGVSDAVAARTAAASRGGSPSSAAVDRGEARVDASWPARRRRARPAIGRSSLERLLRALDVGREVRQVGVRVAVLLAGDLRLRDLVQQLDRAVRHLRRLVARASATLRLQLLHVGQQPVARPAPCRRSCPSSRGLLDPVEAGPVRRPWRRRSRGRRSPGRGRRSSRRRARSPRSGRGRARRAPWPSRGRPASARPRTAAVRVTSSSVSATT